MLRWPGNQGVMGDDPPYLAVGTEVSAKYKGAFCEAKVRKVVRSVKCKVNFKAGLGTAIVTDDQIRGALRVGSTVEVKHPDKKEFVEGTITKVQDCSQYTVVFDDGDITTLRRTALCLKSGRHFAESETLDQLPLTHPEHFGNPVVGSRRGGRRSRNPMSDDSSDDDEEPPKGKTKEEKEADIGRVVCVELGDKKKQKDNWFPGLVVAPTAQEVVRIRVKDEYLVRSFKDGRYFTVPKKEATEFTREIGSKVDNNTLKTAVEKALQYLDKDELPPHWDRDVIFGLDGAMTASDSDAALDSDSSDDEPREEKDHFVAQLYKFMDDRGTPINRGPIVAGRDIDLYKLFKVVHKLGGCNRVTNLNQWKLVSHKLGFGQFMSTANHVKISYKKFLQSFEDFYRKLGCTMVNHPRGNRARHKGGRSLIRDKDRALSSNTNKNSDANDDDDNQSSKGEDCPDISSEDKRDEKDDDLQKRRETKDSDMGAKPALGPPTLERKPCDIPLKLVPSKGKSTKKPTESSACKDMKKAISGSKVKGVKVGNDDENNGDSAVDRDNENDHMEELDVEDMDDDNDKLTPLKSKNKEEITKGKEPKTLPDSDRKSRVSEVHERRIKPSLSATIEKKPSRSTSSSGAEKKSRLTPHDNDRKTVRSIAAEFERKSRNFDVEKKDYSGNDGDRKPRIMTYSESDKKIRPSLTATLERKRPVVENDKKGRQVTDSERKARPSLIAEPDRKKVRPSLTADTTRKVSRVDNDGKRKDTDRKLSRPADSDKDDSDRRSKSHDGERKVHASDSSKFSTVADGDKKSLKAEAGDSEKKANLKSKKGDEEKKRLHARKRKECDDGAGTATEDNLDLLPAYKNVCVGDKLKVYYGPTHESKVTYEAKVLEIEGEGLDGAYLVHYTGWNNRYDEWIKRSRIADNLSWSPARAKRRHQTQSIGVKKVSVKRRTVTPGRDTSSPHQKEQAPTFPMLPGVEKSRDSQPPRSSTPSSVTSSSSRTKSPATRPGSARITRNTLGDSTQTSRRTRTRRISGQTDIPSESDSDASESGSEAEPSVTRKRSRRLPEREEEGGKKENPSKKKVKKKDTDGDELEVKEGYKEDTKDLVKDEDFDASSESPSEEKVQNTRTRKGTRLGSEQKLELKVEPDKNDENLSTELLKGRDFDLNQLRSELKGIDKTVKASPLCEDEDDKTELTLCTEETLDIDVEESTSDTDDVYEFKEPEPFEFEVLSKRESSVESTGRAQRRLTPRIFDDLEEDESQYIQKKVCSSKVVDSESSEEGSPARKRFRKTFGRKDDDEFKSDCDAPELVPENILTAESTKLFSSSEEAFEKLKQSPSYRFSSSPVRVHTPTPTSPPSVSSHSPLQAPPVISNIPTVLANRAAAQSTALTPSISKGPPTLIAKQPSPTQAMKSTLVPPKNTLVSSPASLESKPAILPVPVQNQSSTSSISSRPPTLAVAVKTASEVAKRPTFLVDEWGINRQQVSGKQSLGREEASIELIKSEKDDSLPPLVSPLQNEVVTDRTSPEPPQLLPMLCPSSSMMLDSPKVESKEVSMPEIKKETICDDDPSSLYSTDKLFLRCETPIKEEMVELDAGEMQSLKKTVQRKTQIKRKKAVSKEFVEDTDSDSSDEERRLIIDKSDSSDLSDEFDDESLTPSGRVIEETRKISDSPVEHFISYSNRKDDINTYSKHKEVSSVLCDGPTTFPEETVKIEEPEETEADSHLCSLLCEETIPGSPAPPNDIGIDLNAESNSSCSSDQQSESNNSSSCKFLEMPFASVPGNTRSPGPSTTSSASVMQYSKAVTYHGEKSDLTSSEIGHTKPNLCSNATEASPVIDNTPPTTPDSSISTASNSPRGEHGESPTVLDNDSSKSQRDSEDVDNKDNDFSDDEVEIAAQGKCYTTGHKNNERVKERDNSERIVASPVSNKKRRRSRKCSEGEERVKRPRHSAHRLPAQGEAEAGSDSDDNVENNAPLQPPPQPPAQPLNQAGRSPRPSKYNFCVELTPDMDSNQRIALLLQKLQELRTAYATCKQQLAIYDRRRKKFRRREREARLQSRKLAREERRQAREQLVSCS